MVTDAHTHETVIEPGSAWFDFHLKEILNYRELVWLLVRRDFVAQYKQTILGPLWFFISPLLSTSVFTFVFSGIAGMQTEGVPPFLFYFAAMVPWSYFDLCVRDTSETFITNASLFSKVFFPREIVPIAKVLVNLTRFGIQLALLSGLLVFFALKSGSLQIAPERWLLIPIVLFTLMTLSLGVGLLFAALTVRYRDLRQLLAFGMQLWMFTTPVVYSLASVPEKWSFLVKLNPVTLPVEIFRQSIVPYGQVDLAGLLICAGLSAALCLIGLAVFHRTARSFADSV